MKILSTDSLRHLISKIKSAIDPVATSVAEIESLIPDQATSTNKLADVGFVNSSVGTNTANYISDNGAPFQSVAALEAYTGIVTNNDYAFVVGEDDKGNTTYTRYKYNATSSSWAEEYVLNNSSFTAHQWEAINSNVTASDVEDFVEHVNETHGNPHGVTKEMLGIDDAPYTSLFRRGTYLYEVSFDSIPQPNDTVDSTPGACTSYVKDGKLYRNFDWDYNEQLTFYVHCDGYEGIAAIPALTRGNLDADLIGQLPYHMADGVNDHGIMVSEHVLYNDWEWHGEGTMPITRLTNWILSNVTSMSELDSTLAPILSNIYIPSTLEDMEYLLQFVVTDGVTTCAILPNTSGDGYQVVNITDNPKLTNFRWVEQASVHRTELQNRPTGVERWNMIDEAANVSLENLRFTKAYESTDRLSEFIGIDGTDKWSSDAQLEEIYEVARAEYERRKRDGKTWQTTHSVVYSNSGLVSLCVQEDWGRDYAGGNNSVFLSVTDYGFQDNIRRQQTVAGSALVDEVIEQFDVLRKDVVIVAGDYRNKVVSVINDAAAGIRAFTIESMSLSMTSTEEEPALEKIAFVYIGQYGMTANFYGRDYTAQEIDDFLAQKVSADQKGAANGVAELDGDNKLSLYEIPSYADDVREYKAQSHFPIVGEVGKIYVDGSTNKIYRWNGSGSSIKQWRVFDPTTVTHDLYCSFMNFDGTDKQVTRVNCAQTDGNISIVRTVTPGRAVPHITMHSNRLGPNWFNGKNWYIFLNGCNPNTENLYFNVEFYISDVSKLASNRDWIEVVVTNKFVDNDTQSTRYRWTVQRSGIANGWNHFRLAMNASHLENGPLNFTADGELPLTYLSINAYTNNVNPVDIGIGNISITNALIAPAGAYQELCRPVPGTLGHNELTNRDVADQHPIWAITDLVDTLAGKQGLLNDNQMVAVNSGATSAKINSIPYDARPANPLVTEATMGRAIALVEAKQLYATASQGSFDTKADLLAATKFYLANGSEATPTKNDVAYVLADETHDGQTAKYVIAEDVVEAPVWGFVIAFTAVTFTPAQMAAVNSGATVDKINAIPAAVINVTDYGFSENIRAQQTVAGSALVDRVIAEYSNNHRDVVIVAGGSRNKVVSVTNNVIAGIRAFTVESFDVASAGEDPALDKIAFVHESGSTTNKIYRGSVKRWAVFDPTTVTHDQYCSLMNFDGTDHQVTRDDSDVVDGNIGIVRSVEPERPAAHIIIHSMRLGHRLFGGEDWYTFLHGCDPNVENLYFNVEFYISDVSKLASNRDWIEVTIVNKHVDGDNQSTQYTWTVPRSGIASGWNCFCLGMNASHLVNGPLNFTADGELPLTYLSINAYTDNVNPVDIGIGKITITNASTTPSGPYAGLL